jgi:fructosamine-3-kinase
VLKDQIVSSQPFNGFLELLTLKDGTKLIRKRSPHAKIEAQMLIDLGKYIPTAKVYEVEDDSFMMEYIEDRCSIDESTFGEMLASLHLERFDNFGYEYDTTIGPHHQPNPISDSWIEFFTEHRLLHMATMCHQEGKIDSAMMERIMTLSEQLSDYLSEPPHASLIHGDIWSGNLLCHDNSPTLIDPAIYRAHYEMELSFINLFRTLGDRFYESYGSYIKVDREFFETRQHLYNLYPLLVHVRSFGGGYVRQVDETLGHFEF